MFRLIIFLFFCIGAACAVEPIDKPVAFGETRVAMTKAYIKEHYGLDTDDITIAPQIIVIHYTGINDLNHSMARFTDEALPTDRPDIADGGRLNVSAHYMVDTNGDLYRLMDETTMARHVIGLNYSSIGIENVGGAGHVQNLTKEQLDKNIALIENLLERYPGITYLIGHYEYRCFEKSPLWLEKNGGYRTYKRDPGPLFMEALRRRFPQLKKAPCDD